MPDITGEAFRKLTPDQQKAERARVATQPPTASPTNGAPALANVPAGPQGANGGLPNVAYGPQPKGKRSPDYGFRETQVSGAAPFFDPRKRGGWGLAGPAGSQTKPTPFTANTLEEATDLIKGETATDPTVPVRDGETPPTPGVEPIPTAGDDISAINKLAQEKIDAIKQEPTLLAVQQAEIAQISAQAASEVKAIEAEEKMKADAKKKLGDDYNEDKLQEKITAVRGIAEEQGVSLQIAEGIWTRQNKERASLDSGDTAIYDRIVDQFATQGFDPNQAFNVAVKEYEQDGFDEDDLEKAKAAVASRFGDNAADYMEDEFMINTRGIDRNVQEGRRDLLDAEKLGATVRAGKGGKAVTEAYLTQVMNADPSLIPDALQKIFASDATDDAMEIAGAFAADFYGNVDSEIGDADEMMTAARYIGGEGTTAERDAFIKNKLSYDALTGDDKTADWLYKNGKMTPEEETAYLTRMGQLAAAGRKGAAVSGTGPVDVGAGTAYPNVTTADVRAAKKFLVDEFGSRYLSQNPDTLGEFLEGIDAGETLDSMGDEFRARQLSEATQRNEMYRQSFKNVGLKMNGEANRKDFIDEADRRFERGDIKGTREWLKDGARSSAGVAKKNEIIGAEYTVKFLGDIQSEMEAYEKAGGKLNIFDGTKEQIASKVGMVVDADRRRIATKIQAAIQGYRRSMSGVAFSVPESEEYKAMFPDITKNMDLNNANIDALTEVMGLQLDNFYSLSIGTTPYDIIFNGGANQSVSTEMESDPNAGPSDEDIQSMNFGEANKILSSSDRSGYSDAVLERAIAVLEGVPQQSDEFAQAGYTGTPLGTQSEYEMKTAERILRDGPPREGRKQCGEYVNDKLGLSGAERMGDDLPSKQDGPNYVSIADGGQPAVGGYFVMDTGSEAGHAGLITGVTKDGIYIADSNYDDAEGYRPNTFISKKDPQYKKITGFGIA